MVRQLKMSNVEVSSLPKTSLMNQSFDALCRLVFGPVYSRCSVKICRSKRLRCPSPVPVCPSPPIPTPLTRLSSGKQPFFQRLSIAGSAKRRGTFFHKAKEPFRRERNSHPNIAVFFFIFCGGFIKTMGY